MLSLLKKKKKSGLLEFRSAVKHCDLYKYVEREALHHWMDKEEETLVYLECLPHHHRHHEESKNRHLKILWGGEKKKAMKIRMPNKIHS